MKWVVWLFCAAASSAVCLSADPISADDKSLLVAQVTDGHVAWRLGNDLLALYETGQAVAKPYLWPARGPKGVELTRAWPMEKGRPGESADHVHQKSIWFCHGDVSA